MSKRGKGIDATKLDPHMRMKAPEEAGLEWHDPREGDLQVSGLAWFAQDKRYRRLPVDPAYPIRPEVSKLADCPAGAQIRFRTDSPKVAIRAKMRGPANMNHMPATGQCGFDCYIGPFGNQLYLSTARMSLECVEYEATLVTLPRELRQVTLNLPLYQGLDDVRVGLVPGAKLLAPPRYASNRRIIFYGTSITQGGCVARPGMAYTNILSRRINAEFINLGFSGNGRGDPEVASIIAGIERPGLFVLDYEGNCLGIELLRQTFPEFIRILREAHPRVPILAVSQVSMARDLFYPETAEAVRVRREFQKDYVAKLRRQGDKLVFFKDGSTMLGRDFHECAVDGVHPTDLGFRRIADSLEPTVRKLTGG